MPVALSQIRDLLLPGLWGISGKYPMIERQWPKVFRETNSSMALERRAAMRYLGLAQLKQEGGPTSFDNNAGQRFVREHGVTADGDTEGEENNGGGCHH